MKRFEKGVTLIELVLVVTLLGLLSVAMFAAMRIGLSAFTKADDKLMANRRAAGAQRILQSQLEGLMPVMALCSAGAPGAGEASGGPRLPFFGGAPETLAFVSTFSLQEGWRGHPQVLQMFVIPGEENGVRLMVNETPYTGPLGAGRMCRPGESGTPQFVPPEAGPQSFVLADKLAYCRFSYLAPKTAPEQPDLWLLVWKLPVPPEAIRVEMAPLDPDPSRIQPLTITAPLHLHRDPMIPYADY